MERVEETRKAILDTVCSGLLTHEQKVTNLERLAESLVEVLELPDDYLKLKELGVICDLNESNCPPRPRYIVPDYAKLFRDGCKFLQLEAPRDLDEALNVLSIFIRHVPSVTNFPVFIGFLDRLLEPFVLKESREAARKKLLLFMRYVDRTITDSFCHADIGPEDSVTGRLLLECEKDEPKSVPNVSFLYDPDTTPEDYALLAAETALGSANPASQTTECF
jgi:YjjI family glycine radical enzyme